MKIRLISIRLGFALLALMTTPAFALVTYNGTNGVSAQVFNDAGNDAQRCARCHSSAVVGAARNGAPDGVNFNTYANATSGSNHINAVSRVVGQTMPPLGAPPAGGNGALVLAERNLIQTWGDNGYLQFAAPTVTTSATVSGITRTTATVNGSADPNGAATTGTVQYGVSPTVDSFTTAGVALGSGGNSVAVAFNRALTGLSCGTTYSYRARAQNTTTQLNTVTGITRTFATTACDVPEINQGETITVAMSVNGSPNPFALQLSATGEGSIFTWDISAQPASGGGTASVPAGTTTSGQLKTINYTPPTDTSGSFSFTVRVTDQSANTDTIVVTVDVGLAPPVISQGAALTESMPADDSLEIGLNATDTDSAALTWSLVGSASHGDVIIPDGATASGETKTITYTPNPGVSEVITDTFTIQVADESGNADTIEITIHIIPEGFLAGYVQFTMPHITGFSGSFVPVSTGLFAAVTELTIPPLDPGALIYDWSGSSPALLDAIVNDLGFALIFDTTLLSPGHYWVDVVVSQGSASVRSRMIVTILENIPAADDQFDCNNDGVIDNKDTIDCDGDGILNLADGVYDLDDDGIQDYLDAWDDPDVDGEVLSNQTGDSLGTRLLVTEPGLKIRLGSTARFANRRGALISIEDIAAYGGVDGELVSNAQDTLINVGGIYDFEITGMVLPGGSARVVIPLSSAIPVGAEYRKYHPMVGWRSFVTDSNNAIASARSILGICPAPGDVAYTPGLKVFDNCIRLTIQDGGPNDTDGSANGVIRDPGGVAVPTVMPERETATPDDGSGGVMHPAWLLVLLGLWGVLRLRRVRRD